LYGSKFHRLKQSRGQQGIGISAAGLYGQLTTGKPVVIISKTGKGRPAFEIELVGVWRGGRTGVQEYLEQTVVANPHLALAWVSPKGERFEFPRVSSELPREAQEIKPHPHAVELGRLQTMLADSPGKTVKQVLCDDFSRVSPAIAAQVCQLAK